MSARLVSGLLLVAMAFSSGTLPASAGTAPHRTAGHGPGVRPFPYQTVRVPRRAVLTVTVPRKTPPAPGFPVLPKGVGGYFAMYIPEIRQGWVDMADPGSSLGWPAQFPLIGRGRFPFLVPHHRYRVLIAVDHAGRVPLPFPMHVLRLRRTAFGVTALTRRLPFVGRSSPVAIGASRDSLAHRAVVSTGIALDWAAGTSATETMRADACPAATPFGALECPKTNFSTYVITTTGFGAATPLQILIGEGFNRPVDAPYVSAYAANLPTAFNAATMLAFGIQPPDGKRYGHAIEQPL